MSDGFDRLSYPELAELRGCSIEAARSFVRRRKWRTVLDNHGGTIVLVPTNHRSALTSPDRTRSVDRSVATGEAVGLDRLPTGLRDEIEQLIDRSIDRVAIDHDRAVEAEKRAAVAEAQVTELRTSLDQARREIDELKREIRRPWWAKLLGWPPDR